jgi:DNA repair exonuclease SbcCD ATPase subunit
VHSRAYDDHLTVRETPGHTFLEKDETSCDDFAECVSRIPNWVDRIVEEIQDASPGGAMEAMREAFEKQLESLPEPERPFTQGEAEQWKERLDRVLEKIAELETEQTGYNRELQQLRTDIAELKGVSTTLPKKAWVRAAFGKVFGYVDRKGDLVLTTAVETSVRVLLAPVAGGGS